MAPSATPRLLLLTLLALALPAVCGCQGRAWGLKHEKPELVPDPPIEDPINAALEWLAVHQNPAGFWDANGFMQEDRVANGMPSEGAGGAFNDVGVTGLAMLAFLGSGNSPAAGQYHDNLRRAMDWLVSLQNPNGLIGADVGTSTLYNHGIATAALAEILLSRPDGYGLRKPVTRAVEVIQRARNPLGAWRYSLEPAGESDTVVTGWMVAALNNARAGGVQVETGALAGALTWFDTMTDQETGRTRYAPATAKPSPSMRARASMHAEYSEGPTAVSLLCRLVTVDRKEMESWRTHPQFDLMQRQVALLQRSLPVWDPRKGTIDLYYWAWGTFALRLWGGAAWSAWRPAVIASLVPQQRAEGNFRGSWDPLGPWGEEGGRVYSTALAAITLQVAQYRSSLMRNR